MTTSSENEERQMASELSDHPFSPESVASESGASDRSERAWLKWVGDVERLLGHDIDGNDVDAAGDGFSMDEAYDRFRDGATAFGYSAVVKGRARYRAFLDRVSKVEA